ncbi:MAG: hypothetical protein OXJ52_02825 [Oligoflexia bacterium]|nr:hypothetical protein [Oligoflexia bacterium]
MAFEFITDSLKNIKLNQKREFLFSVVEARNKNNKRYANYTQNRFSLYDQTAVSLVFSNGKCVAFSTIWSRTKFWGNSVYRFLNRMWKSDSYRHTSFSKEIHYLFAKNMIKQQLEFMAKRNITKYTAFISIEGKKHNYLKWLSKKISVPFNIYDELCLICPNKMTPSCWQTVAFLKKSESFPFEILKKEDYFEKNCQA